MEVLIVILTLIIIFLLVRPDVDVGARSSSPELAAASDLEIWFFPDSKLPCDTFYKRLSNNIKLCRRPHCELAHYNRDETTSLMRIFLTLQKATRQIDLCVYDFTQYKLADFLIGAKNRGIRIRIITDAHLDRQPLYNGQENDCPGKGDRIPSLQEAGIDVRIFMSSRALMHNKFVIVDNKYLIMGSFNWTHRAVVGNHEAVIMTSEKAIVDKCADKFAQIWSLSRPRPSANNFLQGNIHVVTDRMRPYSNYSAPYVIRNDLAFKAAEFG